MLVVLEQVALVVVFLVVPAALLLMVLSRVL
jgi:hypothetical protein